MAWTSGSAVNAVYVLQMGTNATKPSTDGFKGALFTSSATPAQSATVANNEYNSGSGPWTTTNETVTSGGYSAGGTALTSPTWAQNYNSQGANVLALYTATNLSWSITGSTTAVGIIVYDTTAASTNILFSWNYFGSTTVSSGTLTVQWNANGIGIFQC